MAKALAVVVVGISMLHAGGGLFSTCASAQEPRFYRPSHPYRDVAYRNPYPWQSYRVAARFNYNPYVPVFTSYSPPQKPFADVEVLRPRSRSRGVAFDPLSGPLDDLIEEYRYYGLEDLAEGLVYR